MLLFVVAGTLIAGLAGLFLLEVVVDGVLQDPFARFFVWAARTLFGQSEYEALAALVHPEKGVTLTPYSTVEPSCDRNLLPAQLVLLPEDDIPYVWGIEDGTGAPIELTGREYFERYVFNADYTAAPETAVDTVLMQGNALENVASAYPEGRFVEYHFPGLDEQMAGYDWCSLKLVFECYQGDWYLVGLVHSEWTV